MSQLAITLIITVILLVLILGVISRRAIRRFLKRPKDQQYNKAHISGVESAGLATTVDYVGMYNVG